MNRREFMTASGVSLLCFGPAAWAGGHNPYCDVRDSGGGFRSNRRILVMGDNYRAHLAELPKDRPVTVLAETKEQYRTAVRQIHTAGSPYPKDSIVVMDLTRTPDSALAKLDTEIVRVRIVHAIPTTRSHLRAIHGGHSSQTALPRLQRVRDDLNESGAIDLTVSARPANARLREVIADSKRDELIVVIGHRTRAASDGYWDPMLPRYNIKFHDETTLAFSETLDAPASVWFMACNTFDDVVRVVGTVGRPGVATTRNLNYIEAANAAKIIRDTGSSTRKVISEVQRRPTRGPAKREKETKEDEVHKPAEQPDSLFQPVVQINDGAWATDDTIQMA